MPSHFYALKTIQMIRISHKITDNIKFSTVKNIRQFMILTKYKIQCFEIPNIGKIPKKIVLNKNK